MTDPSAAPVPAAQPAPAAPAEKWNVLSIVAFVLSIVGFNIVAIILGFIGLSQVKKTGERGRGFALAAVIIGFATLVIGIIVSIVVIATVAANTDLSTY
jgi:membrane protease YdiL (CAAX protease family)